MSVSMVPAAGFSRELAAVSGVASVMVNLSPLSLVVTEWSPLRAVAIVVSTPVLESAANPDRVMGSPA